MPATRLFLIRHGETLANREFRYIGARDDALSPVGETQAVQIAEALAFLPVSAVYSSPLQRAYRTAQPIAARHGLEVQLTDKLRECDFGSWEGLSRAEVLARSPEDATHLSQWEQDATLAPPGGESFAVMQERACSFVDSLARQYADQSLVLVS